MAFPFLNRELSWIEFNARVLDEALQEIPPLEQLKFLSIVSSNYDEFFMVRVASQKSELRKGDRAKCPSGLEPSAILDAIAERSHELVALQYETLTESVVPALREAGLSIVRPAEWGEEVSNEAATLFESELFPAMTTIGVEAGSLPPLRNLTLHIAVLLASEDEPRLAVIPLPAGVGRFRYVTRDGRRTVLLVEDVVEQHVEALFPKADILESSVFRVTRDADMGVDEDVDEDFVGAMSAILTMRKRGEPIRLEIATGASQLRALLALQLGVSDQDVYDIPGPVDLKPFMDLCFLPGLDAIRYKNWKPQPLRDLDEELSIWDAIKRKDVLMHHPYEAFDPFVELLRAAADDEHVVAIKMTLYRTSSRSPVVNALIRAAEKGKQVIVLVELKARFDEESNILRAEELEAAGAIVIHGIAGLKVHSKIGMIVRREPDGMCQYLHLGTGNYNEQTAKLYVDMGLMTVNPELCYDAARFFNAVLGYSEIPSLKHLVMAPTGLKQRILGLIARETERSSPHAPGLIMCKMNSLADPDVVKALYEASRKGVQIRLNVRGICTLLPGVPGQSETIEVVSVIDRYLEHTRIFYFENGGEDDLFMSSADWMPRNLEKRVELMFPILDPRHKERVIELLRLYFQDNRKAHRLLPSGRSERIADETEPFEVQRALYEEAIGLTERRAQERDRRLQVRRRPPGE